MNIQETMISMGVIVMITLPVTTDLPACGKFNFETPSIIHDTLVTKERERVNMTFTVRDRNCSLVYSDITIFKYEKAVDVFVRQCQTSLEWPANNITCYCLETPAFCTLTFIADRKHNAKWKFSTGNNYIQDAVVTFTITYPPHVTGFKVLEYNSLIPKHKIVTVVCSWENGNPPSWISLLDRYNTVLQKGDKSGNISYTFSRVECFHAGIIRCEADRWDRNMSITMLVECPPEFVMNTSSIMNLTDGKNADMTFPFRSPTLYINSCHINQMIQSRNVDTNMFPTVVMNCTKAGENTSTFSQENKHCLYSVTGEPPDLRLTIHVRNLTREDSGLWHVTISNDEGSGEMYLKVIIELNDSKENQVNTDPKQNQVNNQSGIIIGVTCGTLIALIIAFLIIKGKVERLRKREKREINLLSLGTDTVEHSPRLSAVYYEIPDTLPDTNGCYGRHKTITDWTNEIQPLISILI